MRVLLAEALITGNLALARALGDFDYKKNASLRPEAQIITSDPEVIQHQITEEDEFIIIACDGLFILFNTCFPD